MTPPPPRSKEELWHTHVTVETAECGRYMYKPLVTNLSLCTKPKTGALGDNKVSAIILRQWVVNFIQRAAVTVCDDQCCLDNP